MLKHIPDTVRCCQRERHPSIELDTVPIHLRQSQNLFSVSEWSLIATSNFDQDGPGYVHAWICLEERHTPLCVEDSASTASLKKGPPERRADAISIQADI
jgi:hypothetical protein